MDAHLNSTVTRFLEEAGWRSNRSVPVKGSVPEDHPAWRALSAYGGLHIHPDSDAGIECATSDIDFNSPNTPPEVTQWSRLLRSNLVPIAEVHRSHGLLCVASDGACYGSSYIHDAFYFEGESLEVAEPPREAWRLVGLSQTSTLED